MDESTAGLNAAQREAVFTLSGPLLVLAGAGTGKTRVITHRMAQLIRSGIEPRRILSVTFTNKAAKEMQERTAKLLGRQLRERPTISTFHSWCVRVLRSEINALGYPNDFTIYDRGDQEAAARHALQHVKMADKAMRPGDLLSLISRWKMAGLEPTRARTAASDDVEMLAAVAYRRYQLSLKAAGAVDFDDLLLLTGQLFRECPDVLERQQASFDHVQIDEYQDTNGSQFDLVEALVRPHKNLCVVGDDDQSIYGWRGADVSHILGFQSQFPGAKIIRLEDNYRCTDAILELANELVRHNRSRHDKRLVPHKAGPDSVRFLSFPDEVSEAAGVAGSIRTLVEQENVSPQQIAVLFRTNEQPRMFEQEFRAAKIRYVLIGGQSFFDRREVRDMMAYLKAISQPEDNVSLRRIVNVPPRGIGETTMEKLLARSVKQKSNLWDAAETAFREGEITEKAARQMEALRGLLERYRRMCAAAPLQLGATVRALIEELNYHSVIEKNHPKPEHQQARKQVLEEFVDSIHQYVERAEKPSLAEFLEQSALVDREQASDKDDKLNERAVKLLTLHSAKGLEFPHVFLVGLEEGILPHKRSVDDANAKSIEEERRLCYVGITRAMDRLTITRAESRMKWGKRRDAHPSRFLHEMQGREEGDVQTDADDFASVDFGLHEFDSDDFSF